MIASAPRRVPAARRGFAAFAGADRGVAAIEFAFIAPFLIVLFLGGFELTHYVNSLRKLGTVANSIGQMMAQNTTGSVSDPDLLFAADATMLLFPDVLARSRAKSIAWKSDIAITMSSVTMTPKLPGCTSSCIYVASVVWSSGANLRPCILPQLPAANTATPTPSTLPIDVYGPGSLIVVDIVYNYTPIVATRIFGAMPIHRSVYIQPRYVPVVKYVDGGQSVATACP